MIDDIPPFDYRGMRVSARVPPARPGLPRAFVWIVSVNNVKMEGFPFVASATKEEILAQVRGRADSFLAGKT